MQKRKSLIPFWHVAALAEVILLLLRLHAVPVNLYESKLLSHRVGNSTQAKTDIIYFPEILHVEKRLKIVRGYTSTSFEWFLWIRSLRLQCRT